MFNFIKNLGLAFKNKDMVADALWGLIGPPITIAKRHGSYKNFVKEFMTDEYLTGFFTGYLNFMLMNFFRITKQSDRGQVLFKVYRALDPIYFSDAQTMVKTVEGMTKLHGKKKTNEGVNHAAMTVAVFQNIKLQDEELKSSIYLEAKKFYESGEWVKRAAMQSHVMGKITGQKGGPKEMPENQAIAFRIMELSFVRALNKKFKVKNYPLGLGP